MNNKHATDTPRKNPIYALVVIVITLTLRNSSLFEKGDIIHESISYLIKLKIASFPFQKKLYIMSYTLEYWLMTSDVKLARYEKHYTVKKTTVTVDMMSPARKDYGKQNPSVTELYLIMMKFGTNSLISWLKVESSKWDFIHHKILRDFLSFFFSTFSLAIKFIHLTESGLIHLMIQAVDIVTPQEDDIALDVSSSPPPIDTFQFGSFKTSIVSSLPPSQSSQGLWGLSWYFGTFFGIAFYPLSIHSWDGVL